VICLDAGKKQKDSHVCLFVTCTYWKVTSQAKNLGGLLRSFWA